MQEQNQPQRSDQGLTPALSQAYSQQQQQKNETQKRGERSTDFTPAGTFLL